MMEELNKLLEESFDEMVDIRRFLHENPELSFEEVETPKYIANYHRKLGHDVEEGIGGRGVVAKLHSDKPGPTIALRADFDALPIQEENDVAYKSKVDGIMHACGHDGHTAQLLVLAKVLNKLKEHLNGSIVFIHQHAEEIAPGGAIEMIKDGCLEGVDLIFGTHLWTSFPLGSVMYAKEDLMANADFFEIKIQGEGGHGAQPHLTKDSILIGSQMVQSLQHIVSRHINPADHAVISVGAFEAYNAYNVIADTARLTGTVRTFKEEVQEEIMKEMDKIVKSVAGMYGAKATLDYKKGYPALINHKEEAEFLGEIAKDIPGVKKVEIVAPEMGGEDFSYYLKHVKGAYFFVGAKDPSWETVYPHHHPKFDIDERSMLIAAKTLGQVALAASKKYR